MHAPGTPAANATYQMMDGYLAQLNETGCIIAMTADHGMNAKHKSDLQPDVVYLQQMLGAGKAHVILPTTEPNVVHHGSLGSYAAAYLLESVDQAALLDRLQA